jgi:hypothetical protein
VAITRCERGEDVADDEDGHQAHEVERGVKRTPSAVSVGAPSTTPTA